ncbi:MAG TPA: biotin/lipoyl-containing protein [bacterium]|nr:biotin/lipoyl-containing protein [bacterium]
MAREVTVRVAGREIRLAVQRLDATTWRVAADDGASHIVRSIVHAGTRWLHFDGETIAVPLGGGAAGRTTRRTAGGGREHTETLEVPMPGAVTRVAVREGEVVAAGQPIAVIEAMKMEHVIRAPHAGRVLSLRVRQGEQVDAGAVVAELGPPDAAAQGPAGGRG